MLWRGLLFLIIAVCVASPVSALRRNSTFTSESENALLIVGVLDGAWSTTHVLRRIDLETGRFIDPPVNFRSGRGAGINENNRTRRAVLLAREVPPGHYARVSIQAASYTPFEMFSYHMYHCFAENAPVYELRAGQIAVIPLDHIVIQGAGESGSIVRGVNVTQALMMDEFALIRREYPEVTGEAVFVEPTRVAQWEAPRDNCAEAERVSFLPAGAELAWVHEMGVMPDRGHPTGELNPKEAAAAAGLTPPRRRR